MKECRISEDTVIGNACRRIPGTDKDSCYMVREVGSEPSLKGLKQLEPLCLRLTACSFQNEVLELVRKRIDEAKNNE